MAQTFEDYVEAWDMLVEEIEELNGRLKILKGKEMPMRKEIASAIDAAQPLVEGVNHFTLSDGRRLKVTHKIERKVDESQIETVRGLYEQQNDTNNVVFDALLRVKYELSKRDYDKLPEAAQKVVSRMITTKDAAPTVGFD